MSDQVVPELPPVVFVPSTESEQRVDRALSLARNLDGSADLFCFTSPERLRHFHGTVTPWCRLSRAQLEQLVERDRVARCHLDPVPTGGPWAPAAPREWTSAGCPVCVG